VAIKTKNILTTVDEVLKLKNVEEKTNNLIFKSIYDLNIPISNYIVKDNYIDINNINNLSQKINFFLQTNPLTKVSCITIV